VRAGDVEAGLRLADLAGRRVALWGFGREGRATLAALRHLAAPPNAIVIVTDRPPEEGVTPDGTEWVHGGSGLERLLASDVVVRTPGISRYREDAERVAAATLVTTGTNLWFAEHADDAMVAVTGSKGKSTTASVAAHLARAAGLRTVLAGNIGVPLLSELHPHPAPDLWVVELSSQQTSEMRRSPRVGVLTNLYREHLDWHGTLERYVGDKLNLFVHRRDGVVVLNREDAMTRERARRLPGRRVWFADRAGYHSNATAIWRDGERLVEAADLRLQGRHNLLNCCAALCALEEAGVDARAQAAALTEFTPLRHRLEPVGETAGVRYVNDSIATIPEAAVAALDALGGPVVLIAGGFDRGQDHGPLVRRLADAPDVVAVITLSPSGDRLAADLHRSPASPAVLPARDLEDAVHLARERSRPGVTVLLSPAAPSYGAFRDFEERGDAFCKIVLEMAGSPSPPAPGPSRSR
jgi:UDP-N-acetylmuramoylalanine--D-glutamate ligase